ncbi:PadR family transcriptional regulator [Methanobacterium petrolearium]|uniref:PadR family transcriptional regulator n=1 Tax=Methanobacterium petrolearium TaxID=710190 RepID=UPI001AEB261B|nr:PadR family transcriptional regulator [Methanobacterium petrolearium]MBP1946019.1 DNA-binding PadR family transcriptional regulator [Methanobacterium petrolearium]BDZ70849.1 PadR family transcriptional regulator [Methanobacterium petrolearium]
MRTDSLNSIILYHKSIYINNNMTGIWKFVSIEGKEVRLLTLFVLHSLNEKPRSGYDLLKLISERTGGGWTPSKGTLYPLLKQLDEEGLIEVSSIGKRSKIIYDVTPQGKKLLFTLRKVNKESEQKFSKFRELFMEMFGEEKTVLQDLTFKIQETVGKIPPQKEEETVRILEECISNLKKIE